MDDNEKLERGLQEVFDSAIVKAQFRMDKPGNVAEPWKEYPVKHLEGRMYQEIHEYMQSRRMNELLDIINTAAFLHKAMWDEQVKKHADTDLFPRGR